MSRRGGGGEGGVGGARGPGPAGRRRPCTRSSGRHRRSQLGPKFPTAGAEERAALGPSPARAPGLLRSTPPTAARLRLPARTQAPSGELGPRGRVVDPGPGGRRRDRAAAQRVGALGHSGPAGSEGPGRRRASEPAGLTSRGRAGEPCRAAQPPRPSPAGQSGCPCREQRGAGPGGAPPHRISLGTPSSDRGGSAGPGPGGAGGAQGRGSPAAEQLGPLARRARAAPSRQVARVPASREASVAAFRALELRGAAPGARAQPWGSPRAASPRASRALFPACSGPAELHGGLCTPRPPDCGEAPSGLLTPASSVSLVPGFLPKPEQVSGWSSEFSVFSLRLRSPCLFPAGRERCGGLSPPSPGASGDTWPRTRDRSAPSWMFSLPLLEAGLLLRQREALRCDLAVLGDVLRCPRPGPFCHLAAWPPPSVTTLAELQPGTWRRILLPVGWPRKFPLTAMRRGAVRVRAVISSGQSHAPARITSTGPGAAAEA